MKATQCVFQRYEKKYLLTREQYEQLLPIMAPIVRLDDYGKYTICNIYYDTDSYELIRTSLGKPVYKEKFRIRSYGIADGESNVFLELKKKVGGIVYKRRMSMPYKEAQSYLSQESRPCSSQISKEIDYFLSLYRAKPKTFIAYDRMAYVQKDCPDVRITFDFALRWRDYELSLTNDTGEHILHKDMVLMEVKVPMALPLWFTEIMNELEIYPISFSKYGVCYTENLIDKVVIGG